MQELDPPRNGPASSASATRDPQPQPQPQPPYASDLEAGEAPRSGIQGSGRQERGSMIAKAARKAETEAFVPPTPEAQEGRTSPLPRPNSRRSSLQNLRNLTLVVDREKQLARDRIELADRLEEERSFLGQAEERADSLDGVAQTPAQTAGRSLRTPQQRQLSKKLLEAQAFAKESRRPTYRQSRGGHTRLKGSEPPKLAQSRSDATEAPDKPASHSKVRVLSHRSRRVFKEESREPETTAREKSDTTEAQGKPSSKLAGRVREAFTIPLRQKRVAEEKEKILSRRARLAALGQRTEVSKVNRVKSEGEEHHPSSNFRRLRRRDEIEEPLQPLAPGTICLSTYLTEADTAAMPGVDFNMLNKPRPSSSASAVRPGSSPGRSLTNGLPNGDKGSSLNGANGTNGLLANNENPKGELERNIDNVIFGDVTFKAWYPSWYPKEIIGEKGLAGESKGVVVSELYVCKRCFAYGKVLVEWVRHCRCCEEGVPGREVYKHGGGGAWSVWEVDGDVEILFCQKLSLFAKLFLDNKSVFFDVSGFNYFLLVHTSKDVGSQQIVGFFSKEKMSWDNNNLACILIFPPWQRKGLGSILMGVSYAIARREEILGGPEKPISDLGRKGYKRFWGAEIARCLLMAKETDRRKGRYYMSVEEVSRATWILPEDCLSVLRDMGLMEKAGKGKGAVERVLADKAKVREWVQQEKLSLERVVDEDGFIEGYAMKEEQAPEDAEMGD